MKAYTDIEQSKKLAEFLPFESADHHYVRKVRDSMGEPVDGKWSTPKYGNPNSSYADYMVMGFASYETIPCWSLSALLELIPPYLGEFKDGIDFGFSKAMNGKWYSAHYIKLDNTGLATFTKTVTGDTAIDAAVEMVVWLKENKYI